jgi:hypothetical protein
VIVWILCIRTTVVMFEEVKDGYSGYIVYNKANNWSVVPRKDALEQWTIKEINKFAVIK